MPHLANSDLHLFTLAEKGRASTSHLLQKNMASLNKVLLIGNLGADPETRALPSGDAVTNIRIATTTRYKDKSSGEMKELTEWHRIVFFGRLAEIAGEYLRKGSSVYVEGQIRTRKWQDQSGQDRYFTEIVADQMQMLGSRSASAPSEMENSGTMRQSSARSGANPPAHSGKKEAEDMDDDIPF